MNANASAEISSAKCHCHLCNGPIEFPIEDAGRIVTCPHCATETELFIPLAPSQYAAMADPDRRPFYRATWFKWSAWILGAALFGFFLWRFIIRPIAEFGVAKMAGVGLSMGGVVVACVLICFLIFWAVLWILFPVFVYFGLHRVENVLREIARNTRRS